VQLVGQLAPPPQTYVVAHTVLAGNVVHVPSADAPCAAAHAWHVPLHATLQHTPSKQPAVVVSHSRQPACLQSGLPHDCPLPLRERHVPALEQ
jgi:hypothetical protein